MLPDRETHAPGLGRRTPDVQALATIAGVEAVCRGTTLSVYPLVMYRAWGSAALVSQIYFAVGVVSLLTALTVPALTRLVSRRRIFSVAILLYVVSAALGIVGGRLATAALLCNAIAAATSFVCFNAYVLDCIPRAEFGRLETLRLFYGAVGWVIGPALGAWLLSLWGGAPFVVVALAALLMLWLKLQLRLGEGRTAAVPGRRRNHPLANVRRFFAQPRLVAGWFIALMRSCGWWFYFVYVGIFAVEHGLGDQVGGFASSVANLALLLAPLMLRWMQRHSVRSAVRAGCLLSGACFLAAALASWFPWATIGLLIAGTCALVLLDVCGGLPFMMAVKPSERTEMSSVYSSFRDASGILSPGVAWLVLLVAPLAGVFAASGAGLLGAWLVAGRMHPHLGVPGALRSRNRATRS
jgi:MFS family permease